MEVKGVKLRGWQCNWGSVNETGVYDNETGGSGNETKVKLGGLAMKLGGPAVKLGRVLHILRWLYNTVWAHTLGGWEGVMEDAQPCSRGTCALT